MKKNTQLELDTKMMTVKELTKCFKAQLRICRPHLQEIRWIDIMQKVDFSRLPKGTVLILTDFAASMNL